MRPVLVHYQSLFCANWYFLSLSSLLIDKPASEGKVVKNNQPLLKNTSLSNQKPVCVAPHSNTVPSGEENVSLSDKAVLSSNVDVSWSPYAPSGSRDFPDPSDDDEPTTEEMKMAESEPPPEPVDNIPPSPFTLRTSNCKKYLRPGKPNKMSSEPVEAGDSAAEVGARHKHNSVLSAGGSSAAKPAAKPAGRGGGRVRDYTVLHPSCVSVCNVTLQDTIDRSIDELVTPATPADLGEAGQMRKKSDAAPPKPTRYVFLCLLLECFFYFLLFFFILVAGLLATGTCSRNSVSAGVQLPSCGFQELRCHTWIWNLVVTALKC